MPIGFFSGMKIKDDHKKRERSGTKPGAASFLVLIAAVIAAVAAGIVLYLLNAWKKDCSGGLFSWSRSVVYNDMADQVIDTMERNELTELYQNIPSDSDPEAVERLVVKCADRGVRIYALSGEPEWARESDGRSLIRLIERVSLWNEALPEGYRISGIMSDIEPHLLKGWDEDAVLMQSFADGYTAALKHAEGYGLELIACIPYYFDDEERMPELERLVSEGCTGIAVMNYYRGSESDHIDTEAELAKKSGRRIITIYELQKAGRHGLTDKNTYRGVGLEALYQNYNGLRRDHFPQRIDYALHSFEALSEMTEERNSTDEGRS